MRRLWTLGLTAALLGAALIPTLSAQTPGRQDEFRPVTPEELAQGQEHLAATPLVFWGYAVVWVVLLVYVLTLWRRVARVERELGEVAARLEARRR
jgi:CcmD family protein